MFNFALALIVKDSYFCEYFCDFVIDNFKLVQVVIVFKIFFYWNVVIERFVKVYLELKRKFDGEISELVEFIYQLQLFGMWGIYFLVVVFKQ